MSIGFNFKVSAPLAFNKRVSLSFEALKPGTDFLSVAMKVLDGICFQYNAVLPTLKTCCLGSHHHSLSQLNLLNNLLLLLHQHLLFHLALLRWLLSLNNTLLTSKFSFVVSSSFSAFVELERITDLLWIRFWLKEMLWVACSSIQTTKTFTVSTIRLFHFLIIHVFTEVPLLVSFKNFSFTFITCLPVQCKRPSSHPILASTCAPH